MGCTYSREDAGTARVCRRLSREMNNFQRQGLYPATICKAQSAQEHR